MASSLRIALAAALLVAPALAPSALPLPSGAAHAQFSEWQLRRAGSRRGRVCATYHGRTQGGRSRINKRIGRTACFASASQCRAWFYAVQSAFPVPEVRRPCR